jgi:sporulation protein YlmC with PRC-barrel domain
MLPHMTSSSPTSESPPNPLLLSNFVGRRVSDADGRALGRLRDIGIGLDDGVPRITCVSAGDRGAPALVRTWVHVAGAGAIVPGPHSGDADELFLRRDVLDHQVYDLRGRRLTRVGDVVLDLQEGTLTVVGIETGAAAILRRIGLRRLAGRRRPLAAAWRDVHLLSGPGHGLQLRLAGAAVHRLDNAQLVELVRRASVRQGDAVLATLPAQRRADVGNAVAQAGPRRRSTDPLGARKHAPA